MEQGSIARTDIKKFIELLQRERRKVFAPVHRKSKVLFTEVSSADGVILDYWNTDLSPKGLFLPPCEVICTFTGDEPQESPLTKDKQVVFGMRPCDAAALSLLDRVFSEGSRKDPYWLARRENTVIISIACGDPLDSCFCASVGGGPAAKKGSDILVYAIDDMLLFEAFTEKGKGLMDGVSSLLKKPKKSTLEARKKYETAAKQTVPVLNLTGLREKLHKDFDSPFWSSIAERCLGCGVCTYMCPTCHCFDITDQTAGERGRRIRSWDSCQYSLFTLHASGHNPRPSKKERMRQRILHKFLYAQDNYKETFCVGCGRCIRSCPVNLDIKETIAVLSAGTGKGA
jgi:sulfhydrogenase subunit beta (sulfur reductase)